MVEHSYLMENCDEAFRLEMKTDDGIVKRQAMWAGLKPGMRVADLGCGAGNITSLLHEVVQPGGESVGIDSSKDRIAHANQQYGSTGLKFTCRNLMEPLDDLGGFDLVWVRFVLEYHRTHAFDIVKNISRIVKPGGTLCLIDLDQNCLGHHGFSDRLSRAISGIMKKLEQDFDFDPYIGVKLYSFLFDLDFQSIDMMMSPHHLLYGKLNGVQDYDWTKKVEIAAKNSGYEFNDYDNGYEGFYNEFKEAFSDPRRFVYTPLICCKGIRPAE